MDLTVDDYNFVRSIVLRRSGIVLDAGKEYLIDSRLAGLIKRENVPSGKALMALVRSGSAGIPAAEWERRVVDVMTTNETSFFRDSLPFEALKTVVLPDLIARRAAVKQLNLWCAASSTGQEPYTIAMILREVLGPAAGQWKISFVASDLSRDVLARAAAGKYSQLEVNRGLPASLLVKYFVKNGLEWQIKPELRAMIDFREVNLLETWPTMPPLDVVFLRNVLIYFDQETKKQILGRVRRLMKPDGYFFLGGAETTLNLDDHYERAPMERSGCYRLKTAQASAVAA